MFAKIPLPKGVEKMNKTKYFVILPLVVFLLLSTVTSAFAQNRKNASKQKKKTLCRVKKGECLWKIAKKYSFKLDNIIEANPQFENPNLIYPKDKVYQPQKRSETEAEPETDNTETDKEMQSIKQQVITLVNQERKKRGLKPYQSNAKVTKAAQKKAKDMAANNYFSHQSPTYGSPSEMLNQFNIDYSAAGENIAKGQQTAQDVMDSWMNSPGHRRNILSKKYNQIGIGVAKNERGILHWVQMFIKQ